MARDFRAANDGRDGRDGRVPTLHREQVKRALALIDQAAAEIGGVAHTYPAGSPVVAELGELLMRCDLLLVIGDTWLSRHPARG